MCNIPASDPDNSPPQETRVPFHKEGTSDRDTDFPSATVEMEVGVQLLVMVPQKWAPHACVQLLLLCPECCPFSHISMCVSCGGKGRLMQKRNISVKPKE